MDTSLEKKLARLNPEKPWKEIVGATPLRMLPIKRSDKRTSWTIITGRGKNRTRTEKTDWDTVREEVRRIAVALSQGNGLAAAAATQDELVALGLLRKKFPDTGLSELLTLFLADPEKVRTVKQISVEQAVAQYIASAEARGAGKRHLQSLKHRLGKVTRAFRKPVSSITTDEVSLFLSKSGGSPKTKDNLRGEIACLLRWCRRQGWLPSDRPLPTEGISRFLKRDSEAVIYTPEEMHSLLNAVKEDPKALAFVALGAFAGLRSAEICRLDWNGIRENGIHLSPSITKTARRRVAEYPDCLKAILEPLRPEQNEPVTYQSQSALYKRLRELAGTLWKPNGLRHSFVSYHLELHRNPPRTSKASGHSLRVLETVYLKLVDAGEALKYFNVFTPLQVERDPKWQTGLTSINDGPPTTNGKTCMGNS